MGLVLGLEAIWWFSALLASGISRYQRWTWWEVHFSSLSNSHPIPFKVFIKRQKF